jgi:hypothetical protein
MSVLEIEGSVGLFSGRFDPPHLGHLLSIARLGKHHELTVVVLDYPEQKFPISYRVQIVKEALSYLSGGPYHVEANKVHFGKITKGELATHTFDFYASGNLSCVHHMESLGYPCYYVERAYEYAATNDRIAKAVMEAIG